MSLQDNTVSLLLALPHDNFFVSFACLLSLSLSPVRLSRAVLSLLSLTRRCSSSSSLCARFVRALRTARERARQRKRAAAAASRRASQAARARRQRQRNDAAATHTHRLVWVRVCLCKYTPRAAHNVCIERSRFGACVCLAGARGLCLFAAALPCLVVAISVFLLRFEPTSLPLSLCFASSYSSSPWCMLYVYTPTRLHAHTHTHLHDCIYLRYTQRAPNALIYVHSILTHAHGTYLICSCS